MNAVIVVVALGLLPWVSALDVKAGETHLPTRGGRGKRTIRRADYPLLFWTMLVGRLLATLLLISILTGWFMQWIQMSV